MNPAKIFGFFAAGFLAVLLAGCFNPVSVVPPSTADNPLAEPFSVDIMIGEDSARSVAGPDVARIKGDIRNIIQLIVIDDVSGEIVAFEEARRGGNTELAAELRIESIPFGRKYHFLLLMGHLERNYDDETDGEYVYTSGPPTLLAAGLKEQTVTGSGKVTVTMWPLIVDTVFTAAEDSVAPVITAGKPGEAGLMPVNWNVTWTIKRALTGSVSGLAALINAQKIVADDAGEILQLKSGPIVKVRLLGDAGWSTPESSSGTPTLNGNIVTGSIGEFTKGNDPNNGFAKIGTTGAVNFEMKYVPFNLHAERWQTVETKSAVTEDGVPVWIIRNGVNDEAQNDKTDFNSFHHPDLEQGETLATDNANGNGAVRFKIEPKKSTGTDDGDMKLMVKDGMFLGPKDSNTPKIKFITEGYTGDADVYYAVVSKDDYDQGKTPDYSAYSHLAEVAEKIWVERPVDGPLDDGEYIYLIVYKDGEVSYPPYIINTAGDVEMNPIWGDEPYKSYYVAPNGSDGNPGTKGQPLATVQTALAKLAEAYESPHWQGKETDDISPGAIIILGTVNVEDQIDINNESEDGSDIYPPIILCDDPETSGGKLQATIAIGTKGGKCLVNITNGAKVTLAGDLVLSGTGDEEDVIRGVNVTDSMFTMNGGTISGNSSSNVGSGGVAVFRSTFTMNGGTISGNSGTLGSGVVTYRSTFTMNGGTISGNTGGGVCVTESTTFTMNDGTISDNSASSGGGVSVTNSTFTMNDGTISDNFTSFGGGVLLISFTATSQFIMNGGTISKNIASNNGGGVCVFGTSVNRSRFNMYDGTISENIASNSGGGVYMGETTAFSMIGGTISGNESSNSDGGGVFVAHGDGVGVFYMSGGEISGNKSGGSGGGVYCAYLSKFCVSKGTIYGYDGNPDNPKNNEAKSSIVKGHAVYIDYAHHKDDTVGPSGILSYNFGQPPDSGWD